MKNEDAFDLPKKNGRAVKWPKGTKVRALQNSGGGGYSKGGIYELREPLYETTYEYESVLTVVDDNGSSTNGWGQKFFTLASDPDLAIIATAVEPKSILGTQVGGSHYTDCAIQPIEYIWANKLGFSEGNVVKYITRWRSKGGIKDLEKAKHHIALLIEHEQQASK